MNAGGRRGWVVVGMLAALATGVLFLHEAVLRAGSKDLWVDEVHGIEHSARQATYGALVYQGARGQGSAAPLDYIILKGWDQVRAQGFLVDLPRNIYYRIPSIFWDFSAGLLAGILFLTAVVAAPGEVWRRVSAVVLVMGALVLFFFKGTHMHFALEARPYALWNSLGFLLFAATLLSGSRWPWTPVLGVLLAMTSSGAVLQLSTLALADGILRKTGGCSWKQAMMSLLSLYALPLSVGVYYALRGDTFGYVTNPDEYQEYASMFWSYWTDKWKVPVLAAAGLVWALRTPVRRGAGAVFLSFLFLYAAAPLVNHQVLTHGFFFTSRQYLYFDQTYPLILLAAALALAFSKDGEQTDP